MLPRNGRIFFPAKGNLAYKKGGWGGACRCGSRPTRTRCSRPSSATRCRSRRSGANNGGIWFDFNDAKPRDLRHGRVPRRPRGQQGHTRVRPRRSDGPRAQGRLKADDWHHVVLTWENFDTGQADARAALYIDGKLIGEVKDRAIAMDWDIDKAGIYVAINYIGLLDEFALFDRALRRRRSPH